MKYVRILLFLCFLSLSFNSLAQQIFSIKGKVTDALSGEAVPFASVSLQGSRIGVTTDFEGFFTLKTKTLSDSVVATFLGYHARTKAINKSLTEQKIDFQLDGSSLQLKELTVRAGENPTWRILRKIIENKPLNDRKNFTAYEYESYTRTEIDVDNISDKLKKKKFAASIKEAANKIQKMAGEDGKPLLPVFVSEVVSDYYFREEPKKTRELIKKQKLTGVGVVDNDVVTQLIGSSFQDYNFYTNWMRFLSKDFASPIADGWRQNYDYYLADSTLIGENFCYVIEFEPKNKLDLAFTGKMWVDKKTFALTQINATIGKEANLNYIEKIKIQQEFDQIDEKAWMPTQTRVVFDISEVTPNSAGFIAKFYTSNRNFVMDKPRPVSFYEQPLEIAMDSKENDEVFWQKNRHIPLTTEEKGVYAMVDTLKNLPIIRHYTTALNILTTGHVKVGVVDIGPYPFAYAYNNFEGSRFRVGFRTNNDFSKNWYLKSHIAYGTHDNKFKYGAEISRVLSRQHYSEIGIHHSYDVEQLGVNYDDLGINYLTNTLFRGFTRFGTFRRPYYIAETGINFNAEPTAGLTYSVGIRKRTFQPNYPFLFRTQPENGSNSPVLNEYSTSEFVGEIRYARGEIAVRNNRNRRIKLKKAREYPIITFRYTLGVKAIGGEFQYQKFGLSIQKSFRMGILGRTETELNVGYTPSTVPYPLLFIHQGNPSVVYVANAFNMMNNFEFISDRYASLRFQHNFDGLLTNRIPLIKKLNWRTHITGKILLGSATNANQNIIPLKLTDGQEIPRFGTLNPSIPYTEVGYGVDNIFKCLRVDFLHRLTYLDNPQTQKFAIKFSLSFKL